MLKLKILSIGKFKEVWLTEALNEYVKRLKPTLQIEWVWAKDNTHLVELAAKEAMVLALDPEGKAFNTEQFAEYMDNCWKDGGSRLCVVIGGAEGLPLAIRKSYPLISLSPLTFTHQMTYLIFVEQVYRAIEIKKGSQYHK